jgi:hypothetical protein
MRVSRAGLVTILGPSINRRQDAFGHTYDPVNLGVDFLGPCIAPDGKDSAVSGGQAHGHDFQMMEDGPLVERAFETVEGNLVSCQQDMVAPEVFGTQTAGGLRRCACAAFLCRPKSGSPAFDASRGLFPCVPSITQRFRDCAPGGSIPRYYDTAEPAQNIA